MAALLWNMAKQISIKKILPGFLFICLKKREDVFIKNLRYIWIHNLRYCTYH